MFNSPGMIIASSIKFPPSQLFVVLPVVEQKQILTWLNKSQSRDKSEWLDLITEINSEVPKLLKSINHK